MRSEKGIAVPEMGKYDNFTKMFLAKERVSPSATPSESAIGVFRQNVGRKGPFLLRIDTCVNICFVWKQNQIR